MFFQEVNDNDLIKKKKKKNFQDLSTFFFFFLPFTIFATQLWFVSLKTLTVQILKDATFHLVGQELSFKKYCLHHTTKKKKIA